MLRVEDCCDCGGHTTALRWLLLRTCLRMWVLKRTSGSLRERGVQLSAMHVSANWAACGLQLGAWGLACGRRDLPSGGRRFGAHPASSWLCLRALCWVSWAAGCVVVCVFLNSLRCLPRAMLLHGAAYEQAFA